MVQQCCNNLVVPLFNWIKTRKILSKLQFLKKYLHFALIVLLCCNWVDATNKMHQSWFFNQRAIYTIHTMYTLILSLSLFSVILTLWKSVICFHVQHTKSLPFMCRLRSKSESMFATLLASQRARARNNNNNTCSVGQWTLLLALPIRKIVVVLHTYTYGTNCKFSLLASKWKVFFSYRRAAAALLLCDIFIIPWARARPSRAPLSVLLNT